MTDERAEVPKLEVTDLKQHFPVSTGIISRLLRRGDRRMIKAVDGVSVAIRDGEAFGLAGESGCGKSTLGKTAIRLLEPTAGRIRFDGVDVTTIDGMELKQFRREAQIIHQDPYKSQNPRFTVFRWVKEPLDVHGIGTSEEREAKVYETLELAGLRPPEAYANAYPSELSGGERQRVGIARALVLEPSFLLADEPASMLDVSIRASILDTFERLQSDLGLTALYISHDLSLLKHICDRIGIMYLGELVEVGPADQIINNPKHPYTQALVSSVPVIDPAVERERVKLVGEVPDPVDVPGGCRFHPRCPKVVRPDRFDLPLSSWRAVWKLREDLLRDEIESGESPHKLREAYAIPVTLSDTDADSILSRGLERITGGEMEQARDLLGTEFSSPCVDGSIDTFHVGEEQTAQCVLYDGGERLRFDEQ